MVSLFEARLRASIIIGSLLSFEVSLIVLHAKSIRDNRLDGRNGPCGLKRAEVLTWAFEAMASLRVLGEKSLSFIFPPFDVLVLESLGCQGVTDRETDRDSDL